MTTAISKEQLEDLERRAVSVREALRNRTEPDNPVAIEFAGSPKSGKSSTISTIVHFFKRMEFRVFAPSEGASQRTPEHLRQDRVAFNVWTINYAISHLLSAYYEPAAADLIILDRGCFDSVAWTELHRRSGQLSNREADDIRGFVLHPKWTGMISRVYLFTCDPEVSLQRETAATLTELEGATMNRQMLQALLARYQAMTRDRDLSSYSVLHLDTTEPGSPRTSGFRVADDLLNLWEAKLARA